MFNFKIWILFLTLAASLFAVDPDTTIVIDSTSCNVRDSVHAPTGQSFVRRNDAVVSGFESIPITRMYVSENSSALNWEGGWAIFPHCQFTLSLTEKGIFATIQEPEGMIGKYRLVENTLTLVADLENTHAPPFNREISGRTDIRNNRIVLHTDRKKKFTGATLYLGNGGQRIYRFKRETHHPIGWVFLLEEEIKPNSNRVLYKPDNTERIENISTWNPQKTKKYASLTFTYRGKKAKDRDCTLTGSDGTSLYYHFWRPQDEHLHDFFYFEEVFGDGVVAEKVLYDVGYEKEKHSTFNKTRGPFVKDVTIGGETSLKLSYYYPGHNKPTLWDPVFLKKARDHICEKVLDLKEPVGPNGSFVTTHSFRYEHCTDKGPGVTKVRDALNNETHYYFDIHFKPSRIEFYTPAGLARTEIFLWDGRDLAWHIFQDPTGKNSFARRYEHDGRGNITKQTIYGNLTGICTAKFDLNNLQNGIESYAIRYDYSDDGFNLPIKKEEDNGLKITYSYKKGTDLLTAKIVYDKEKILSRYFWNFNDDQFLLEEISDDGKSLDPNDSSFTERKIVKYTPNENNFPSTIEEKAIDLTSGQEVLLRKKILHYNKRNQVEKEDVYDSKNSYCYSTETNYQSGLISWQTDPLNQKTTYQYNARQQLKERSEPGCAIETFKHDGSGRLKEKILTGDEKQVTQFEYNALHHKISETQPTGAKTTFDPDRFGSPLAIIASSAPNEKGTEVERATTCKYDFLGREIYRKDPNGDETTTSYNAYGSPIHILRQDGSEETFVYYKNGHLHKSTDPEKTSTVYSYDVLNRPLTKEIFSPKQALLSSETRVYDAFHLRSYTDPLGYTTFYEHDSHGRKISEERDRIKTEYSYDSFDEMHRITQGELVHVTEHDFLGRAVEERKESLNGKVLYKKQFVYKDQGCTLEEITFPNNTPAVTTHQFDAFGRQIKKTDPENHATLFSYSLKPHTKTTTDALNRKKIETYNPLGKVAKSERQNELGKTISLEEYFYDLGSNLARQISSIYQSDTFLKTIETQWIYGPLNRLDKLVEAAGTPSSRTTSYTYTKKGLLDQTIKPSGKILQNSYNGIGHLINLKSLDGSIHYLFEPDALGFILAATDLNTGLKTIRRPDPEGNILREDLANGFTIQKTYDSSNRCKTLQFPDGSQVIKTYDAVYLREVAYEGLVSHYTDYDLSGNLLSQELPLNTGIINCAVDSLSRTFSISSPYHSQRVNSFNPIGKVESLHTTLPSSSRVLNFAYDSLGQLLDDGEHLYSYDSHYNRLSQDGLPLEVDDLNQVESWEYDTDGNPYRKEDLTFSYDALDRLIGVELPDHTLIAYTYDPFHRRLTKIFPDKTIRYLYDGNNEIGFEEKGQLSIRILAETSQAEIGSAIALTLKGSTYVPLHDLQGNVSLLLNPANQSVVEEYLYSPFGQLNPTSQSQNPWRYLSKHTDTETGLVFFGRRYYAPSQGRFLTADPKGYTDSLNLYAYALNDPFLLIDPYGLENESSQMSPPTQDLGSITISSLGTFGSGAWNSFSHPIDALGGLSNDLTHLSSSAFSGNLSTLTAAWKAMDWEQRMRLISFQTSRVVGIGVTVSGLGGLYQLGCRAAVGAYFGGRSLLQSVGRLAFSKNVTPALTSVEQLSYSATKGAGEALAHIWPPNNGFLHSGRASMVPGAKLDRLGSLQGRFLALEGTPLPMRSMPPSTPDTPYRIFQVMKSFEVEAGPAAPWFNQPGMGLQFKTDIQIKQLIDNGCLKTTKEILK